MGDEEGTRSECKRKGNIAGREESELYEMENVKTEKNHGK